MSPDDQHGPGDKYIRNAIYDITAEHAKLFRGINKRLTSSFSAKYLKNILDYDEGQELGYERKNEDIGNKVYNFQSNPLFKINNKIFTKMVMSGSVGQHHLFVIEYKIIFNNHSLH